MSDPDHFARLGLPRRFSVDLAALEAAYLARSQHTHPDIHRLGADAEQRASLEVSAGLNEAFATLRDPFRRADYLLGLHGGPTASAVPAAEPSFLMDMLELREQAEEARANGEAALSQLEAEVTARRTALLADVGRQFSTLEGMPEGDGRRAPVLLRIRQLLNAVKYLRSLVRDLRTEE